MTKKFLLLLAITILPFAAQIVENTVVSSSDPLKNILTIYKKDLENANHEIHQLKKTALAYLKESGNPDELREQLLSTRLSYKKVEHYMEYFHKDAVSKYINGAPLPKQETVVPEISIIDPNGLQTLDELIFSDHPEDEKEQIADLSKKLFQFWTDLYRFEKIRLLQHRYVFEASRYQLARVYTLGLTGFDTPGSVNAIPEAISSLETLQHTFTQYQVLANAEDSKAIQEILSGLLSRFIDYLKTNDDFDTLDRMHILRMYLNPLYSLVYDLQKTLKIEFVEEVDPTLKGVNYHAKTIFSNDFLNKSYFAQIADSDLTDPKKIELGKILFYDPALSSDLTMSCASCHNPEKAFTDGLAKSQSNKEGITTLRNAPTVINSVYAEKYFYDLREYDLERQVKHVVYDQKEFNMDFVDLSDRLKESKEYVQLFKDAYGDRDKYVISSWSISNALAAYVASLSSWDSPFDRYARGESNQLSQSAINGYNLFMGKAACGTCHFAPTFNGTIPPNYSESESEVLGVPVQHDTLNPQLDPDPGRIASGRAMDEAPHYIHAFKTVSIRNVELTGPYMHNGAYQSLEDVMDFYNRGGGAGMGLEVDNQTLPDTPLDLTKSEITDIISFMHSLTDTTGMTTVPGNLPKFGRKEYDDRNISY